MLITDFDFVRSSTRNILKYYGYHIHMFHSENKMVARRKSSCGNFQDSFPLKDGSISQKNGPRKVRGDSLFLYFAVITGNYIFLYLH